MTTILKLVVEIVLASFLCSLCVCQEEKGGVKPARLNIASERFLQEVSHKSVFLDFEPTDDEPVSSVWEKLPFGTLEKGAVVSLFPEIPCVVAIKDGALYGAAKKYPVPSLSSLESPYYAWTLLDDSMSGAAANKIVKDGKVVYVATEDNVIKFTFNSHENGCGSIENVQKILKEPTPWKGEVTSLVVAPFLDSLFVGSSGSSVAQVSLCDGGVVTLDEVAVGASTNTMLWVEKWRALVSANSVAVYLVFYDELRVPDRLQREWVGGIVGWTPTSLGYDEVNNAVWLAEMESVHQLTSDLQWNRYGYAQLAPMQNVSCVCVANGVVWVGSDKAGLSRIWSDTSPQQHTTPCAITESSIDFNPGESNKARPRATFRDPSGDPWAWLYYYGARYLPSNVVIDVIPTNSPGGEDSSVFVVTRAGLALLHIEPWTLPMKAEAWKQFQLPQHDRHGITSSCGIAFGDRSQFTQGVSDSDGLWTSMHAMAQVYRYIATGEAEARALAWRAFEGLELTSVLTPAYPNYVARSFCKMGEGNYNCPDSYDDLPDGWYNGTIEGWLYKGDTSSDELAGQLSALPMIYDYIARTPDEKDRVLKIMEGVVTGIVENGYFLIDPETGKPTKWGYWAPSWLNDQPQYYSERGTNSVEICGWLVLLYSITGKSYYKEHFWTLVQDHQYDYNVHNAKVDSAVDENHSDTELLMLAFHSMFYSRWRLDHGQTSAGGTAANVEADVREMTARMEQGIQRTWLLLKGELNGLWLGIYAGTANQNINLKHSDIVSTAFGLRHWAIDGIQWSIDGAQRIDLDIPTDKATFHERGGSGTVMRRIRPMSERAATELNLDPFVVQGGSGGMNELEPGVWQLQYYILLANKLI